MNFKLYFSDKKFTPYWWIIMKHGVEILQLRPKLNTLRYVVTFWIFMQGLHQKRFYLEKSFSSSLENNTSIFL